VARREALLVRERGAQERLAAGGVAPHRARDSFAGERERVVGRDGARRDEERERGSARAIAVALEELPALRDLRRRRRPAPRRPGRPAAARERAEQRPEQRGAKRDPEAFEHRGGKLRAKAD
jgi:hypothetical protein